MTLQRCQQIFLMHRQQILKLTHKRTKSLPDRLYVGFESFYQICACQNKHRCGHYNGSGARITYLQILCTVLINILTDCCG